MTLKYLSVKAFSKIKIGIFRRITGRLSKFALEHVILLSLDRLGITRADV